jgi:hypothetical protein
MEVSVDSFRLSDFLAYILPGATALAGGWSVDAVWAWPDVYVPTSDALSVSLAFAVSYVIGMLCSSLSPLREWTDPTGDANDQYVLSIDCPVTRKAFLDAYAVLTGEYIVEAEWNKDRFFVCRSMLRELSPDTWSFAFRQSLIRQLRYNSVWPVLIWAAAALSVPIRLMKSAPIIASLAALCTLLLTWFVIRGLARSAAGNIRRETREVCFALLALTRLGRASGNPNA